MQTEEFWLQIHLPAKGVSAERIVDTLTQIEIRSLLGHQPWIVRTYPSFEGKSFDVLRAVDFVLSTEGKEPTSFTAERSAEDDRARRSERLHLFVDPGVPLDVFVSIQFRVSPASQEALFDTLCTKLSPSCMSYLPRHSGSAGSVELILEMALQRNFGLIALGDQAAAVARALAAQLPRLSANAAPSADGLPRRLGWLNWWSAETARDLDFPNEDKDASFLSRCKRMPEGCWLVKLTEEPLDLERPDHVEALAWAYWRFDKVGKRMTPTTKTAKVRAKRSHRDAGTNDQVKRYALRERDANGLWWDSAAEPVVAASAEDALRIYFARNAHGRAPKAGESLRKLSAAYDEIAAEVGLTSAENLDAVEVEA